MPKLSKYILFLFVVVSLHTTYYTLHATNILADENAIPEPFVPCTDKGNEGWRDPEFNSLRPYQASPCGDAPKAAYCNNDYIIEEEVSTDWTIACDEKNLTCPYSGGIINKDYTIYVNDVKLPILGNTENVANSQNATDEFDDAQKVNEYLSWYLSGTNQKAEYGNDSTSKTVDYSGPVKKLLPSVIQEFQRFSVLHKAGTEQKYTDSEELLGFPIDEDFGKAGDQIKETFNHNQIVVCTTKNVRVFGFSIDNPWVGQEIPTPCYKGGGGEAVGSVFRMLDWWESKPPGLLEATEVIENYNPNLRWGYNVPPFPWQFTNDMHYQKAYREWRGHECFIILGKLVCADLKIFGVAELHTNKWADFYQYIPLGTTADKKGGHQIEGVNVQGLGKTVAGPPKKADGARVENSYFVKQNPILYYPHTQSSYDLLSLLNKTQTSSEIQGRSGAKSGGVSVGQSDFEKGVCEVVDVRSNEGDSLTFDNQVIQDKQKVYVRGVLIEVKEVGCLNDGEINYFLNNCPNLVDPKCYSTPSCDGIVQVVIRSTPKIPYAEQIWEATTVGQESAFRRIFPKVEEGAPVSCIADIPGVSDTTYVTDANLVNVDTPGGKKSASDAQLFFPHLGTVYEYFLKGIQTALRPKGYGEPIYDGTLCNNIKCGELPENLPKATGACNLGGVSSRIGEIPQSLKDIVSAAAETYKVPPNLILGIMYGEGLFNASFNTGVDAGANEGLPWSDYNVKNWATCSKVPGCSESGDDGFMGFNGDDWKTVSENIKDDLKELDPSRKDPNVCNLLDAVYGLAWNLRDSADGSPAFPSNAKCIGIPLNRGDSIPPLTCDWSRDGSWANSAIRISEFGTAWNDTLTCATKEDSCSLGGGLAAQCESDTATIFDTCNYVNNSHNYCIFDVSKGN